MTAVDQALELTFDDIRPGPALVGFELFGQHLKNGDANGRGTQRTH
jgi:hypothetical protein